MIIHRYTMPPSCVLEMPAGTRIMKLDLIDSVVVVWAQLEPDAPYRSIRFAKKFTGEDVDPSWAYLTSFAAEHWYLIP